MGVGTVSGTKLYITDPGTPVASPDPWVEIKDIASLGNIAQTFNQVTVSSIGDGDDYSLKGQRSFPNFELTLNKNSEDAGQADLKDAADDARGTLYNFKIVETDGSEIIWKGEVFGYGPNFGGPEALKQVVTSISIRPTSLVYTDAP
ncbi:MAG: hypothetical protein WBF99_12230 [Xanthobacteraceae bacterium]